MEYDEFEHITPRYDIDSLEVGVGLNQVDNLKPSDYFYEAANKAKNYDELEEMLQRHYENQDLSNPIIRDKKECDIVSKRIAELINTQAFSFSYTLLPILHRKLFKGIFTRDLDKFVGKFRLYNISKREPILCGESVKYSLSEHIETNLKSTFDNYKESIKNNPNMSFGDLIEHIAEFVTDIWQTHPFVEGNTRTTAVFTIMMLQSMNFTKINNDIFKENSKYFRNALVLNSYDVITTDFNYIGFDSSYLQSFFEKLLLDKNLTLKPLPKNIFEQNNNSNDATNCKPHKT